jgi:hypothetical protein
MKTTFSIELNENDFFIWIKWKRSFHMNWMNTTFSIELNENDFLDELTENDFFKWIE